MVRGQQSLLSRGGSAHGGVSPPGPAGAGPASQHTLRRVVSPERSHLSGMPPSTLWVGPRLSVASSPPGPTHLWFPLEDDNPATLVTCGQQLSGMVELDGRDDISWEGEREREEGMAH